VEEINLPTGEIIHDFEEIKQQSTKYYSHLYTKPENWDEKISQNFIANLPQLVTEEDNNELNKQVEEDEILKAINQFDLDKAPWS
jgi:hypothetical protein